MADKQSLYELLGLTSKASPEAIRQAHEERRRALDAEPDGEERRNRIAFLDHARDTLCDPRKRAHYDHQSRRALPAPRGSRAPLAILLAAAVLAYPAWRLLAPRADGGAPSSVPSPRAAGPLVAPVATNAKTPLPPLEDIPEPPAAQAPVAPPLPPPSPPPQRIQIDAPNGGVLARFIESTYLVAGGYGYGTAVAIDTDRLLTNCHVVAPNVLKGPIYAISPVDLRRTQVTAAAFLVKEDACVVYAPGLNARPIAMGDAANLPRGASIHNLGFAGGRLTASQGELVGLLQRSGQTYLATTNYCDHGVSGGPLVDDEGRLVGLTSGGIKGRGICLSLMAETARQVLAQAPIAIDAFPTNYMTNLSRRW